ncbi:sensor histidine kinase [Pseudonocardia humida]|uniref:histidine kinase n=1 Tax=Pseudonocardia humida TaxID=2800819 RepID=A0ABT1A106_9PSEU|nr:HAMP domain-containing sensor histidine kinase [Pseudonocardia humida]MCO1656494.1 HAMP domain-containing histidine kinase [Pseudonocardia humida]
MGRLSIRVRLTALYGVMFFAAGAVVILAGYLLVSNILNDRLGPSGTARVLSSAPVGERPAQVLVSGIPPGMAFHELEAGITADQLILRDDTLSSLLTQSLVALALVGALAIGSGWWMAGRALSPLHQITATARRIADDRGLHERIALGGPADELRELADTFDAMLERLGRAFDGQRTFVANASHELRTPLAINRTLIEVASTRPGAPRELRDLGETLLAVNARHERLIDGLLLLARSEAAPPDRLPVDLDEITEHVEARSAAAAAAAGVDLVRSATPAPTTGDPVLLERVVENLVDNAVRYNREGGRVEVSAGSAGSRSWVSVSNTGPVVPDYVVPALFEPFRRTRDRTAASGSGLGLSIVAAVVRAHGGTVTARARPGGGLAVRVELPRSVVTSARGRPALPQPAG